MSFSNHFIRTDVPLDHGLYWGIRLLHEDQNWKIDLWGYGGDAFRSHINYFNKLRSRLQSVDRIAILRIKNDVCHRSEYRNKITAKDIYEAVIRHRIKTTKEFDEWLQTNAKL